MELIEIMRRRRSVRNYTGEPVGEEQLELVLRAGLLSASSKGLRPWELIVVRDRETLDKMAGFRQGAANMLKGADCAIVTLGDHERADMWIDDCASVMANMHLMADSLGLGSCWIQGRGRPASDGRTAEEFLRELLAFPENLSLEAVLSLGVPAAHPEPYELASLDMTKVHYERY